MFQYFSTILQQNVGFPSTVYTVEEKMKSFDPNKGPFALGKITQVPNHRKMIEDYILEYDDVHDDLDGWMSQLPKINLL